MRIGMQSQGEEEEKERASSGGYDEEGEEEEEEEQQVESPQEDSWNEGGEFSEATVADNS